MIDGRVERVGAPQEVIAFARVRMAEAAREPGEDLSGQLARGA